MKIKERFKTVNSIFNTSCLTGLTTEEKAKLFKLYKFERGEREEAFNITVKFEEEDFNDAVEELMDLIEFKFNPNWERIYDAMTTEYKPLENYDRIEETTEHTTTEGQAQDIGTDENLKTGGHKTTTHLNNTEEGINQVSAFDSESWSNEGKNTNTTNGTNTDEFNYLNERETISKNENHINNESNERETTSNIHGNIGVTTSQQMLESEIDLRTRYNFYEIVMKDLDTILTSPIWANKKQEINFI